MQCAKYPNCAKFCAVYWSLFTLIQLFFSLYVESKIKCAVNTLQFTKCAVDINVWFGRSLKQSNVWWTLCTERWSLCTKAVKVCSLNVWSLCSLNVWSKPRRTDSPSTDWAVCGGQAVGGWNLWRGARGLGQEFISPLIGRFDCFVSAGKYHLFLVVWWTKILETCAAY